MAVEHTPLTQEQFDLLGNLEAWSVDEVPPAVWNKIPGIQRLHHTVAIMASGSLLQPLDLNGLCGVAGFDVLVYEPRPKPQEPEGNAYHYVVEQVDNPAIPFILHGPYRAETRVKHWFEADDLDVYWADDREQ